ncbi:MAG: metallophosphoesterase [Opitutaceae bacterium]|nr:metallophosphoesterase [Opitutaceae bacterium]
MKPWSFIQITDLQPGSPRSYRFQQRYMDNWQTAYRQLQAMKDIDLMVVGGDLTRDGHLHDFEIETAKRELDALPFPYYAIPGNIEAGNKWTDKKGGTGRKDPDLNLTGEMLDRFADYFGEFPWSFIHKNVRFSGVYAAVAGSGLPHEERMWHWLEKELPALPRVEHHILTMHYSLFIDELNEPSWDITKEEEYLEWYFSIDRPHRLRLFEAFKKAGVEIVFSGHIHCRRPPQEVEGIRFFRCPGIAMSQWENRWPDGDPRLGFYRFDIDGADIQYTFIPLEEESQSTAGYGMSGHPEPHERDYSQAWEQPET